MDIYTFCLGVILGLGIIPAIQEIQRQLTLRAARKEAAFNAAVNAEITRRETSW